MTPSEPEREPEVIHYARFDDTSVGLLTSDKVLLDGRTISPCPAHVEILADASVSIELAETVTWTNVPVRAVLWGIFREGVLLAWGDLPDHWPGDTIVLSPSMSGGRPTDSDDPDVVTRAMIVLADAHEREALAATDASAWRGEWA